MDVNAKRRRGRAGQSRLRRAALGVVAGMLLAAVQAADALTMVNYYSPHNRERPRRKRTDFIILHTTEAPARNSLNSLYANGECHYMVEESGKVYRIIDHKRVALHTGRSMWNGLTGLDDYAMGIEIVGYHNRSITAAQIVAVRELIAEIQRIYKVPDEKVLTHSMVAYGAPNQWFKRAHRGRKRCGMCLAKSSLRLKLGLTSQPTYDPDVKAGRLINADPYLAQVLYGSAKEQETAATRYNAVDANVIGPGRSAWDIAGDKYRSADVTYIFPDQRRLRGCDITDWRQMLSGTRVVLTPGRLRENEPDEVKTIGVDGATAWEVAGDEYKSRSTVYFLPDGTVKLGSELTDAALKTLPSKTKVLVGYSFGGWITASRQAFEICGERWKFPSTYYRFPNGDITPGNEIHEGRIPSNTRVYYQN